MTDARAFVFDRESGLWARAQALPAPAAPESLHVIMLNVMFDRWRGRPYKSHVVCSERRFKAQWAMFAASRPDVLCLNEVTPGYLEGLCAQDWVRAEYTVSAVPGREGPLRPFGNVMLWRGCAPRIRSIELPRLRRPPIAAIASYQGVGELAIVATHLSAGTQNAVRRAGQLQALVSALGETAAIVLGDLNLHDAAEDASIPGGWEDVWAKVRPGEPGWTFDAERNPMHQEMWPLGFESRRMRLDRILLRERSGLVPTSCGLYADAPLGERIRAPRLGLGRALKNPAQLVRRVIHQVQDVTGGRGIWRDPETYLMPSDHFGLEAWFDWESSPSPKNITK